jgi:hypothetical protein
MKPNVANTKSVSEVAIARKKRIASRLAVAVMALVAMSAVPHSTEAQAAASGSFTLSAPAKLGTIALPAGEYSYTVRMTSSLPLLQIASADHSVAGFIFPEAVKEQVKPSSDKLTLAVAHGETYVRSLSIREMGLTMYYGEPKTLVAKKFAAPNVALATNVQPAK